MLSRVQEDYLKIIWMLSQRETTIRPTVLAEALRVRPPTALTMLRQLQKQGLITYQKSTGARLTRKGETLAEKLVRKHRLLETFLNQVLNLQDPALHEEAEKLEHAISDELMEQIDRYLGFPVIDPHGEFIPQTSDGVALRKLSDLPIGTVFFIARIPESGEEHRYCIQNDLVPGKKWQIANKDPYGDSFLLQSNGTYLAVSRDFARLIWVQLTSTTEHHRRN